jgi:thioredoxin
MANSPNRREPPQGDRRDHMKVSGTSTVAIAFLLLAGRAIAGAPPQPRPAVPAASPQELVALVGGGTWVVAEFGGEHCIPCMHMQEVLQGLRDTLGAKAAVRNFWIQEHPDVARRYRIVAMPTQIVFNPNGEEVLRHIGYFPAPEFRAALQKAGLR